MAGASIGSFHIKVNVLGGEPLGQMGQPGGVLGGITLGDMASWSMGQH